MDAVQLQYFKAVCETGSYSRAAEQLYISPQGISKAIHKLEDELGAPLFTLTQSGLAVTDYGQLLRSRADEYLCQHHRILNEIRQLREASDNVLTIGIRAGFSEGMGKNFLLNFILANPDLVVRVRSFAHDRMEEGMRQPDIPVWVAPGGYDESRFTPLYEHIEKLFLLVSEDHPLARKEAVRVEDLDGYPLISLPHNIGQQPAVDWAVNRRVQAVPDFLLDAADRPFLMRLVQTGKAISFNSGWHYKEYPGIRRIDPVDLDLTIHAYVLCRRDAARTLALERFCAYVRTVSEDQTTAG